MRGEMPKPVIWKQSGKWMLRYYWRARSMWLFGESPAEREFIRSHCVSTIEFGSFREAIESLKLAYRANQVQR